jgi:hypothetical protein
MKEVDSTSSHELSINNEPKEPAVLIEHNEQPHEENPEEDGNDTVLFLKYGRDYIKA